MLALIIGGSGSGKSEFAEDIAVSCAPSDKFYIATMYPWDAESGKRIEKHKRMRADKHFHTLECFYDLPEGARKLGQTKTSETTVLLDCMSNLVANEMYCVGGFVQRQQALREKESALVSDIMRGIRLLCEEFEHVVIVSNDVFTDGIEYSEEMQRYLKILGQVNVKIAAKADYVIEVVCGIPVVHKQCKEGVTDERPME